MQNTKTKKNTTEKTLTFLSTKHNTGWFSFYSYCSSSIKRTCTFIEIGISFNWYDKINNNNLFIAKFIQLCSKKPTVDLSGKQHSDRKICLYTILSKVGKIKTHRDKNVPRNGETERQRDREIERQKDRKIERQKDRKTERQKDRKTERQKDRKTERQKDRKTERQREKYTQKNMHSENDYRNQISTKSNRRKE
jgi:hypothetical protein